MLLKVLTIWKLTKARMRKAGLATVNPKPMRWHWASCLGGPQATPSTAPAANTKGETDGSCVLFLPWTPQITFWCVLKRGHSWLQMCLRAFSRAPGSLSQLGWRWVLQLFNLWSSQAYTHSVFPNPPSLPSLGASFLFSPIFLNAPWTMGSGSSLPPSLQCD